MKTNSVFIVLNVVSWIIFVALCVEAGGLLVNFVYSLFKPEVVHLLYQKLDLSEMYNRSKWVYFAMYSFANVISVLKAVLFYIVIRLVMKLDLAKPFSRFVSTQIKLMSYYTLSIGLLSLIARQTANHLEKRGFDIDTLGQFWADSQAFILMAAVIYVIAAIFSKGVELQDENDLIV